MRVSVVKHLLSNDICKRFAFVHHIWWINLDTLCVGYLQLQDEVLVSDRERIKTTQSNVKMVTLSYLHCLSYFFTGYSFYRKLFDFRFAASETLASTYLSIYWKIKTEGAESSKTHVEGEGEIVTLKILPRLCQSKIIFTLCGLACVLKVMRIVEGLEGKGFRLPLTKGEAELSEKLTGITRQVLYHF